MSVVFAIRSYILKYNMTAECCGVEDSEANSAVSESWERLNCCKRSASRRYEAAKPDTRYRIVLNMSKHVRTISVSAKMSSPVVLGTLIVSISAPGRAKYFKTTEFDSNCGASKYL